METKITEPRSDKDILTEHLNNFKKQVIDFALDLKRHQLIKVENPSYQKPAQNGQFQGIDALVEQYQTGLDNAQSYVVTIEEMLKAEEAGNLEVTINSYKTVEEKKDEAATE